MSETRWELKLGARVVATDGAAGHVQQVIIDPGQGRIVALVVQPRRLPDRTVVVPVEQVADATDFDVCVKLAREQIAALHDFVPEQYIELAEGRRGYLIRRARAAIHNGRNGESGTTLPVLALRRGQPVFASDGHAGNVEILLLTSQGQVRHFVLHRGRLRGRDVIVPVDWVREVDERYVYLSVTRQALEDLPEYTPDSALAAEVDRALWSDTIVREGDYFAIDPILREGVVVLRGHVASSAFKARAERVARGVPGVLDVDNQLVADDDLTKLTLL